jgi:hypothetical protein
VLVAKAHELGLAAIGIAEQLNPRLRRISEQSQNDVYVGTVLLPHDDLRVRAYVKVFPPKYRGQHVYNEVIAHHLARQCSLPTPFTFPVRVQAFIATRRDPGNDDRRLKFGLRTRRGLNGRRPQGSQAVDGHVRND